MNVLFEEDGGFKAGSIMADNDSSLQVEMPSGKRSKIKSATVLLRLEKPSAGTLLEQATPYPVIVQRTADDTALLIMRDTESALDFTEEIKEMLR